MKSVKLEDSPRTLPIAFRKYGYTLRQLWRDYRHAIYEKPLTEGRKNFEVIIIRIQSTPWWTGEGYPSTEDFGRYGWEFMTIEKALSKLKELTTLSSSEEKEIIAKSKLPHTEIKK